MAQGSIKTQLVSTARCPAHWIVTFSESNRCINANLSGNTLYWTREPLPLDKDTIEFLIKGGRPSIDEMKGYTLLAISKEQQQLCRCVHWVWGVVLNFVRLDFIETLSTADIHYENLLRELVNRQSDARIDIDMGFQLLDTEMEPLRLDADAVPEVARTKSDGGQEDIFAGFRNEEAGDY
ncbi:hypothetical protein ACMYSQ_012417 [Aspergillus niger]